MMKEASEFMDNIKYQVFISSTYSDLLQERKKVLDILPNRKKEYLEQLHRYIKGKRNLE